MLLIPLLLLIAGILYYLSNQSRFSSTPVKTIPLSVVDLNPTIKTDGQVRPKQQTPLNSQVSGKVAKVSPKFKQGGKVLKNDILVSIDSTEYEGALADAIANLSETYLNLQKQEAKINESTSKLKVPEFDLAEAKYEQALSRVRKAQLTLENCKIKAPFDASIVSSNVVTGEVVSKNDNLGELYSENNWKINCIISKQEADYLNLEKAPDTISGIPIKPELVMLKIEDFEVTPYDKVKISLSPQQSTNLPALKKGTAVQLALKSSERKKVIPINKNHLVGDKIMSVNTEQRLIYTPVNVVHSEGDKLFLTIPKGRNLPVNIVTTTLGEPVENMKVVVEN